MLLEAVIVGQRIVDLRHQQGAVRAAKRGNNAFLLLLAQRCPVSHHAGLGWQVLRGGGRRGQGEKGLCSLREFV
jgi:hypothetical protein